METELLKSIKKPSDIKQLDDEQLNRLCDEIRQELITTVCANGGHLASNLGTVELTVALHRAFNSPDDKIIFDVSHQCYTHKLLTGRYDKFHTLRTENGITGFTNPNESEHDIFMSGHSSTSISSGLGLAVADSLDGNDNYVISVIGDGALSGGLAYEAINNASRLKTRLIVILNDNKMSISKNVGGMARHLAVIRSRPTYYRIKVGVQNTVSRVPVIGKPLRRLMHRVKTVLKNLIYGSTIFEEMGFSYLGPIDGHDIKTLERCFAIAKMSKRPAFIHAITVKGKGCSFAEQTPKDYHGVSSGTDVDTGEIKPSAHSFSYKFGEILTEIAEQNPHICAVTAAMTDGVGLSRFAEKFPKRFFDVGIAEEHAVTFCSGLAKGGKLPVMAVYSSFLQRGYDQIIHDISIQKLKMIMCIDRAGFTGEDGETHQGLFDVAFLSHIPNTEIYSPCCYNELEADLKKCVENSNRKLYVIRYPKGMQSEIPEDFQWDESPFRVIKRGGKTAIVTYGRLLSEALSTQKQLAKAGESIDIIYFNRIHPIDINGVKTATEYSKLYLFEEGIKAGSFSERFESMLLHENYKGKTVLTAIDGEYVPCTSVSRAMKRYGMDSAGMMSIIKNNL